MLFNFYMLFAYTLFSTDDLDMPQGCKIPLACSHWRVNIGGGRVKLAVRSPDRASRFRAVNLSSYNGWLEKRQNADLTFLKFIPEAGITFLFVNIVHSGTPGDSSAQLAIKIKVFVSF